MNSVHDLGGLQGFGPVRPEVDEPIFHAPWERQALAVTLAMGACGAWTLDEARHARESLPPAQYLNSSYYEIWLAGLKRLMLARGLATAEEWESGNLQTPGLAVPRVLRAAEVDAALAKGTSVEREPAQPPAFAVGERVRTREMHPSTHTRLPRYARGRVGVIERIQGHHVLADANAHRGLKEPKTPEVADWLYSVRFEAQTLWGESADPLATVNLDLWQVHLLKLEGQDT